MCKDQLTGLYSNIKYAFMAKKGAKYVKDIISEEENDEML